MNALRAGFRARWASQDETGAKSWFGERARLIDDELKTLTAEYKRHASADGADAARRLYVKQAEAIGSRHGR